MKRGLSAGRRGWGATGLVLAAFALASCETAPSPMYYQAMRPPHAIALEETGEEYDAEEPERPQPPRLRPTPSEAWQPAPKPNKPSRIRPREDFGQPPADELEADEPAPSADGFGKPPRDEFD